MHDDSCAREVREHGPAPLHRSAGGEMTDGGQGSAGPVFSSARMPLNVGVLLNDVAALVSEMFPKSIRIARSIPRDLWSITGHCGQVEQVFFTFCANARDAMPAGGTLTLRASNSKPESPHSTMPSVELRGPHVLVEIADTGGGIGPGTIERIVLRRIATTSAGTCADIGFSTVLDVIREHGGVLDVRATPVRGTTFQVYFPAIVRPDAPVDAV